MKVITETYKLSYPKHILRPEDFLTFYEMDGFLEDWNRLGLDDDNLEQVQLGIMSGPEEPVVVVGTGGLREIYYQPELSEIHHCRYEGDPNLVTVRYVYFGEFSIVLLVVPFLGRIRMDMEERKEIRDLLERERIVFNKRLEK